MSTATALAETRLFDPDADAPALVLDRPVRRLDHLLPESAPEGVEPIEDIQIFAAYLVYED